MNELQHAIGQPALDTSSAEFERLVKTWEIVKLPSNTQEMAELRRNHEHALNAAYEEFISIPGRCLPDNADSFDRFLLEEAAETIGPGLLICDAVAQRLLEWQQLDVANGLRKLERMFAALYRNARITRGLAKRTITPEVERYKRAQVADELKRLQGKLSAMRAIQRRPLQFVDAENIIKSNKESMFRLWRNLEALKQFCSDRQYQELTSGFFKGSPGCGPKEFATTWIAAWDGRNPKKYSNTIANSRK